LKADTSISNFSENSEIEYSLQIENLASVPTRELTFELNSTNIRVNAVSQVGSSACSISSINYNSTVSCALSGIDANTSKVLNLSLAPGISGAAKFNASIVADIPDISYLNNFVSVSLTVESDGDGDGIADNADNCPGDSNSAQLDTDNDGNGNACDIDDDNDGVLDTADAFALISLGSLTDTDGDGRPNDCDSGCTTLGMIADTDDDADGVADGSDAFPLDSSESVDTDSDGTGNNADTDDDGDTVADVDDALPLDASESIDTDGDGIGNNADNDDDGDGVLDWDDAFPLISLGSLTDTDGNGRPNECDSDCVTLGMAADSDDDGDGVNDVDDVYPLDATLWSMKIEDALAGLVDDNLRGCVEKVVIGLVQVADLTVLDCSERDIVDLTGLQNFIWLTKLELRFNQIADLSSLLNQPNLLELGLQGNPIDWLTFPEGLTGIQILMVNDTNLDSTFRIPSYLASTLKDLDISYQNTDLMDLAGLSLFSKLERLNFSGNPSINWSSLPALANLIFLGAHRTGLERLSQLLPSASTLETADLSINKIIDLALIDQLVELKHLNVAYNEINDISHLKSPLISLNLGGNTLSDLEPLRIYKQATQGELFLWDNPIRRLGDLFVDWKNLRVFFESNANQTSFELSCQEIEYVNSYIDTTLIITWPSYSPCRDDPDRDYFYENEDAFPNDPVASVDTDGDGMPDDWNEGKTQADSTSDPILVLDIDDDGDGVADSSDAFPLDVSETIDTDADGTGNNADTDDDGDGVLDEDDGYPLVNLGDLPDSDGDGRPNDCDSDCTALGMTADTDDDNDGVLDTADGYALISLGVLLDTDSDGFPNECDEDCLATGMTADFDDDNDGVEDTSDAFPLDASETADSDSDGVGDNSDAFPNDAAESLDSDSDSVGDNADNCPSLSNSDQLNTDGDAEGDACDADDDNDGFTDEQEAIDGTNPLSRFSCKSGCFSFDVDESLQAQPLTDGLLVIRHLFGFSGESLTSGAVSGGASRDSSEAIAGYLTDADSQLDIDGDGESKPLTDGLLLIRYLFGFSGDSLISGAIGDGAERDTADEVEAYIEERVPVQ